MNDEIRSIAERALALMPKGAEEIVCRLGAEEGIRPASVHKLGRNILMMTDDGSLLLVADYAGVMADGFEGELFALSDGGVALYGARTGGNAAALRRHFHWCAPVPLRKGEGIPVFYDCDEAAFAVFEADSREGAVVASPLISDFAELDRACSRPASLFRFHLGGGECRNSGAGGAYAAVYAGKHFVLSGREDLFFSEETARFLGESYHGSLEFARKGYGVLRSRYGGAFDLGIVLPDGARAEDHLFVVRELRKRGVGFAMLQPGCEEEHRAVARAYGGYQLAKETDQ